MDKENRPTDWKCKTVNEECEKSKPLSNEIIESFGWKMVYSNSEWSNEFKRIGDETLILTWYPSDGKEKSVISIERDCNKPNEAYKDNIYTKFLGYCESTEDYNTIVRYLNFDQ